MTQNQDVAAMRIGGHASRYLLATRGDADRAAGRPLAGHVVSTFRYGFNTAFDEQDTPSWIAIQTATVPLHPWAIEVPTIPADIRPSFFVRAAEGRVDVLSSTTARGPRTTGMLLAIHTLRATCHELRVLPYTPEEAERARARLPLLEQLLEEKAARRPAGPFQPQIDAILEQWRTADDPAVLANLVGLGIGATPSGDDLLVGLAAGLTALCAVSDEAGRSLQALSSGLRAEGGLALARTTPASRQALAAALDGSFPEPLCLLVGGLGVDSADGDRIRKSAGQVLELGATSGASMLRGLCAAWQ